MPPQFVNTPQYDNDLDKLMLNLAENVRYRREQQARKASEAQELEQKMATGLVPKADITITDEGMRFQDENGQLADLTGINVGASRDNGPTARDIWLQQVGAMFGQDDRSQQGGTNVQSEMVNDAQAEQQALRAQNVATRQDDYSTVTDQILQDSQLQLVGGKNDTPAGTPTLPDVKQLQKDAFNNVTSAWFGMQPQPQPQPQPDPIQQGKGPIPYQAQPAQPAQPTQPVQTPNIRANAGGSVSMSNTDQVQRSRKTGGAHESVDQYARTTETKRAEIIDEIKTSQKNLAGLAFLEQLNNSLGRTDKFNTFEELKKQRVADLKRWEEALSKEGTQSKIDKIGSVTSTEGTTETSSNVVRKGALSAKQNINAGSTLNTGSTAGPKKANFSRGDWRSTDFTVSPDGMTMNSTTQGLEIRQSNNKQHFAPAYKDKEQGKQYRDSYKQLNGAGDIRYSKTDNGLDVVEWTNASGQVIGKAVWNEGKYAIGDNGVKTNKQGSWDTEFYQGAPTNLVSYIIGDNIQYGES